MTIGRHDGHAYLAAMEREAGVAGRMLGWGVLEGRVPPLWEIRPTEFPLAGEVLDRATGVIVHSRYVETRAREHGYDGPLWRIPHPGVAGARRRAGAIEGAPLFGCFGHLNESKRIPQLLRAFAEFRAHASRPRGCCSSAPRRPASTSQGRLERLGLDDRGRDPRAVRRGGAALGAHVGLRRRASCCARRRWARRRGARSARSRSASRSSSATSAGSRSCPTRSRSRCRSAATRRSTALVAALDAARGARRRRAHGRGGARVRPRGARSRPRRRASTSPRSSRRPGRRRSRRRSLARRRGGRGGHRRRAGAPRAASSRSSGSSSPNGHVPVSDTRTGPLRQLADVGLARVALRRRRRVQLALALRVVSPWIMVDELVYSDMARSFADTGHFLHPRRARELRLRLSVAALARLQALRLDDRRLPVGARPQRARDVLGRLPDVSARAPRRAARLRARGRCARRRDPADRSTSATLMTENAFYPVFMWLAYALVRALERPTLRSGRSSCSRSARSRSSPARRPSRSSPPSLTAPLVLAWIERGRPRRLSAWKPLYGIVAARRRCSSSIVEVARGRSPVADPRRLQRHDDRARRITSGRRCAGSSTTSPRSTSRSSCCRSLRSSCSSRTRVISTGRCARSARRRRRSPCGSRSRSASSRRTWSQRIEERNLFYVAPLFLIALLRVDRARPAAPAARDRRGRRRRRRAARRRSRSSALMNINAQSDTPFLQPWWYLGDRVAGLGNVALLAVLASRRARRGVPLAAAPLCAGAARLVALGFLAHLDPARSCGCTRFPRLSAAAYSTGDRRAARAGSTARSAATRTSTLVYSGDNPYRGWENEFWNRSIRHVYDLGAPALVAGPSEPASRSSSRPGSCSIRRRSPSHVRYVLADPRVADRRDARRRGSGHADGGLSRRRAACARRPRSAAGTATPGPGRASSGRGTRAPAGSCACRCTATRSSSPASTQRIAVSGSTTPVRRAPAADGDRDDRRSRCSRAPASAASLRRSRRARRAAERPADARHPRLRLRVRTGRRVRIVVDVSPLSHPRTGVGNYIRGSLLGLAEAGGARRRRVRAGEPRGKREIEAALDGIAVERALPVVPAAHALRTAWSRLGRPAGERVVGELRRLHFSDWMYPPQRRGPALDDDPRPRAAAPSRSGCTPRTRRMHGAKYEHAARTCDVVIVNSRFTGDDVAETLGVPRERIHVAYPGVERGVHAGRRARGARPAVRAHGRDARAPQEPRDADRGARAARRRSSRSRSPAPPAGGAAGARRRRNRPARLHAAGASCRACTAARASSSTRRSSRGSGCRSSRRWRAACPVVASSHPSLDEACGDAAVRADPRDPDAIAGGDRRCARAARRARAARASRTRARSPGSRTGGRISRRGRPRDEGRDRHDAAAADAARDGALHPQPPRAARRARAGRVRRPGPGVGARARAVVVPVPALARSRGADVLHCPTYYGPLRPRVPTRRHGARPRGAPAPARRFRAWTRAYVPRAVPRVLRAARA